MDQKKQRIGIRVLCLLLTAVFVLLHAPVPALAEAEHTGSVNGTGVRVREGPSTNTALVTDSGSAIVLNTGHALTIYGDAVPDSGGGSIPWYSVGFSYRGVFYRGYIRSDLCSLHSASTPTPAAPNLSFEQQVAAFPADYQAALRALHEQHPSWNFEAAPVPIDWTTALQNENVLGRSLTDAKIISYYSTAAGSYDIATGTYIALEGGHWYQAAPALVAYYMDPRNFLNETDIFQFETLTFNGAQSEEAIAAAMRGTFMDGLSIPLPDGTLVTFARAFQLASIEKNVSAFHLLTRCIQEVGRNGNPVVYGNYPGYEGYYNYFNIGANTGAEAGMRYAVEHGWNNPYIAILAGAEFISDKYIAVGQNTPYFQKFSVVDPLYYYWHQYMTNIAAAYSEGRLQRTKYVSQGLLESPFTFRIPVYQSMPAQACALPPQTGDTNNLLRALSVEGYSLTPTFDVYSGVTDFSLIINGNAPSVNVQAVAASSTASVSGNVGVVPLSAGENLLTIYCTSASGSVRRYSIHIVLNGQGAPSGPTPVTVPSGWNPSCRIVGSTVSGITPGSDVASFVSSLGAYGNARAYLTDESGNVIASGPIRTGMILAYFDGTHTTQFHVAVYGDTNRDGAIDAVDLLKIRRYLLGLAGLEGVTSTAADVNHDGAVDAVDLLVVRRTLLGLTTIQQ